MKIIEKEGNILNVMEGNFIAHAISGDFTLGAGVAKAIDEKFMDIHPCSANTSLSEALCNTYCYDDEIVGKTLLVENIFNIVVKDSWRDVVDEDDLFNALEDLREQCENMDIKELYMPKICSGKEKMDWDRVRDLIVGAFFDYDITIYVLTYDPQKEIGGINLKRKATLYNEMLAYISELIDDEEELYNALSNIGFTDEEIEYEGFDVFDSDEEIDDFDEE